jgi:Ca2+-binding EF-hand superfamily protein
VQSDPNEIRELKEIFQALDKDGNGSIEFEELQNGLGDRENGEQLLELLRAADTDGNGIINYTGKFIQIQIPLQIRFEVSPSCFTVNFKNFWRLPWTHQCS